SLRADLLAHLLLRLDHAALLRFDARHRAFARLLQRRQRLALQITHIGFRAVNGLILLRHDLRWAFFSGFFQPALRLTRLSNRPAFHQLRGFSFHTRVFNLFLVRLHVCVQRYVFGWDRRGRGVLRVDIRRRRGSRLIGQRLGLLFSAPLLILVHLL